MALKFRRGTTAQKSGSLAFGEPYVNTTLGTLQIGGDAGDITLGSVGTGSNAQFSGISGSSLDITGNAKIDGNLTLGGTITIGDNSSDNVVVNADLSSSIIPNNDNSFDLGSTSFRYRAVHGTNIYGAINATNGVVSGSSQVVSILSSLNTYTGSNDTTNTAQNNRLTNLESATASLFIDANNLEAFSASQLVKDSTLATYTASLETKNATLATYTASLETKNTTLATYTASLETKNATLATYTSSNDTKWSTLGSLSGSFARTNTANTFTGNQTITGSLFISQDLIVQGSSSIQNISSSRLDIGDNIIQLNVNNPSLRFGGLAIYDSGSAGSSGSFLYDSVEDEFIFVHKGNGTNVTSSHFIMGPETYDNVGNETYLTINKLPKGSGKEHLNDSNITDTGTLITLGSNTTITGTLVASGTTLVSSSAQVIGILSSLNTYTGSNDTTNTTQNSRLDQLSTASGSAITRLTALEAETTNLEAYTSSFAAASVVLTNKTISGASNTLSNIVNASLTNSSITIAGQSTALGSSVTAETIRTAIGTVVTGSAQISHDSTTGYSANRHIDHTAVSISAGSGLTGGGDISTTRTLSIATGGVSNAMLANSTISGIALGSNLATLTIGTGLSGTSYNGSTGVTIANTGVTSITGTANQVIASAGTGAVTLSLPQSINSTATPTFGNLTINGTITASGDITAFYTSDRRHKNNIQTIPNALDKVSKLNGVTWEWNDDVNEVTKSTPKTGLIAQEVQEVLPEVVKEREDGFLSLDYSKMMGLLVEAIKEQQTTISKLESQIAQLGDTIRVFEENK